MTKPKDTEKNTKKLFEYLSKKARLDVLIANNDKSYNNDLLHVTLKHGDEIFSIALDKKFHKTAILGCCLEVLTEIIRSAKDQVPDEFLKILEKK